MVFGILTFKSRATVNYCLYEYEAHHNEKMK